METTNTVKTDPVLEAIKRKLSGYGTVPPDEQSKMIKRAARAARDTAQAEYSEIIRELRAERDKYKSAIDECINWTNGRQYEWGERAVTAFEFLEDVQ